MLCNIHSSTRTLCITRRDTNTATSAAASVSEYRREGESVLPRNSPSVSNDEGEEAAGSKDVSVTTQSTKEVQKYKLQDNTGNNSRLIHLTIQLMLPKTQKEDQRKAKRGSVSVQIHLQRSLWLMPRCILGVFKFNTLYSRHFWELYYTFTTFNWHDRVEQPWSLLERLLRYSCFIHKLLLALLHRFSPHFLYLPATFFLCG